ncbi:hypothetical protein EVG20_g5359 [Dentipellis fragilis]|uniref:Uncharacterized protein n=1 Tax=Dentipellis fragilis TaxID=205917 RepID=A0A4Y9YVH2_9AGAM|nr:hypothetical protein EVG20_g5359 [Dentipellis fragilis]
MESTTPTSAAASAPAQTASSLQASGAAAQSNVSQKIAEMWAGKTPEERAAYKTREKLEAIRWREWSRNRRRRHH